jgi:hypothetical protein
MNWIRTSHESNNNPHQRKIIQEKWQTWKWRVQYKKWIVALGSKRMRVRRDKGWHFLVEILGWLERALSPTYPVLGGTGAWMQGLTLTRQLLYHLSNSTRLPAISLYCTLTNRKWGHLKGQPIKVILGSPPSFHPLTILGYYWQLKIMCIYGVQLDDFYTYTLWEIRHDQAN